MAKVKEGEIAKVYEVHESQSERAEVRYDLEFPERDEELKVHLKETEVLDLFEPLR